MLRVVAGEHRGRRLKAPPGHATRPTSDRVREALSRGAASVTFVESDRRAAATIRSNLDAIGERAEIVTRDALAWLRSPPSATAFDLVLIDPPYDSAVRLAAPLSGLLPAVLAEDATIVSESDKRTPLNLDLPLADERVYGDTRIAIHRAGRD